MTYKQKNWRVFLAKFTGCSVLIFAIPFLISIVANLVWVIIHPGDLMEILALISFDLLILAGFFWIAAYYLYMFPEITISDNGLVLKVLFFQNIVKWDRLDAVQKVQNNRITILLKGGGLFMNRLHGLFAAGKWNCPVILYAADTEIIESFVAELQMYSKINLITA